MIQAYLESKGGKSRELKNAHTGSIGVVASIERRKWLPDLLMVTIYFFNLIEKLILQTRKSNYQPLFVFQGEKEEKEKLLTNYVNSKIVEFYLIKYFFLGQGMAFTIKYNNINPYPSPLKGD